MCMCMCMYMYMYIYIYMLAPPPGTRITHICDSVSKFCSRVFPSRFSRKAYPLRTKTTQSATRIQVSQHTGPTRQASTGLFPAKLPKLPPPLCKNWPKHPPRRSSNHEAIPHGTCQNPPSHLHNPPRTLQKNLGVSQIAQHLPRRFASLFGGLFKTTRFRRDRQAIEFASQKWSNYRQVFAKTCPNTLPYESQITQRSPKELARILQAIGIIPPQDFARISRSFANRSTTLRANCITFPRPPQGLRPRMPPWISPKNHIDFVDFLKNSPRKCHEPSGDLHASP